MENAGGNIFITLKRSGSQRHQVRTLIHVRSPARLVWREHTRLWALEGADGGSYVMSEPRESWELSWIRVLLLIVKH